MKLVLDTNIVLDWLVFEDAGVDVLRRGVRDQWITVITYPPALHELRRVLAYPQLELDASRQADVLERYRRQTMIPPLPAGCSPGRLTLPPGFPRCRDRDDEHFLALALRCAADALVTRDKAVLRLQKQAEAFGLKILSVAQLVELGHGRP